MKILMISMSSIHFFRWAEQLRGAGHQVYWIDVFDSGIKNPRIDFVEQTVGWRNRLDFPGRYYLKTKVPKVYSFINIFNQRKLADIVERKIEEIKPDVVHSFVMYSGCVPILEVMSKFPSVKWVYSAWGNDLFYYQNFQSYQEGMRKVFSKLDYMFADCRRDFLIASKYSFKGQYLGTYPTGGGYDFNNYNNSLKNRKERDTILIKGYEHKFGRCIKILEALQEIKSEVANHPIKIFAANKKVEDYIKNSGMDKWENLHIYNWISQEEVLNLMGNAKIYVGNSISDGMPNTLLEAIIMETFPIQSNPGGATAEVIEDGENGFLIKNPEDSIEISKLILRALSNKELREKAALYNLINIKPNLERKFIREKVLKAYQRVEEKF